MGKLNIAQGSRRFAIIFWMGIYMYSGRKQSTKSKQYKTEDVKSLTDVELVDYLIYCAEVSTKAVNGLGNISVNKWSRQEEKARDEILKRLS